MSSDKTAQSELAIMVAAVLIAALPLAFVISTPHTQQARGRSAIHMQHGGKGFGGGEATRDPEPTSYDPNDPKGKQQAIHKAESFAEYLAKRRD